MALNVNSPTVQAMMQNLPQGIGNMPVYYGNAPVVTTSTEAPQSTTPFPSPKEMLTGVGQQNVYAPTSMIPSSNNLIGGYNPGFNAVFSGYTNPYLGYGYTGYGMGFIPMDNETRLTLQMAQENGLTYEEQLQSESSLYKKMVRVAGINTGHSEEEIKNAEDVYSVKEKEIKKQEQFYHEPVVHLHIKIKVGDEEIADINNAAKVGYIAPSYLDQIQINTQRAVDGFNKSVAESYNNAPERKADNADLVDFFNNHAGALLMNDLVERSRIQSMSMSAQMYSKDKFANLLKNNGCKNRAQQNAVDRYVGRYGIMPDGRSVSPGHDPSIAESFSYNHATGQIDIIPPPNFMRDTIEKARTRFINSI